jgi:hypothetical protein
MPEAAVSLAGNLTDNPELTRGADAAGAAGAVILAK